MMFIFCDQPLTCSWMIPSRSLLAAWRIVPLLLRWMASECPLLSV